MSKRFDMELFLAGVLTGSHAIGGRRESSNQKSQSIGRDRRLGLGRKHVDWFLGYRLNRRSEATRYYFC